MIGRREITIAASAIVIMWTGLAYQIARPADPGSYHRTLLQVAETAHDATQTGRLVGRQELAGRVTVLFARTAFDDSARALAGAQKKFAGQGPPDADSAALRDRLSPLLADSVRALGDTAEAGDDAALRSGMDRLGVLAGSLEDFITAYGS